MYIRPTWWLYFAVFCQHLIKHVMMMMMMIQAEPVTHRALYRHSLQHTGLDSGTACYTHGFHNHVIMNCRVLSCCLFRKNKKVVSESFGSMSCINRKTCSVKAKTVMQIGNNKPNTTSSSVASYNITTTKSYPIYSIQISKSCSKWNVTVHKTSHGYLSAKTHFLVFQNLEISTLKVLLVVFDN